MRALASRWLCPLGRRRIGRAQRCVCVSSRRDAAVVEGLLLRVTGTGFFHNRCWRCAQRFFYVGLRMAAREPAGVRESAGAVPPVMLPPMRTAEIGLCRGARPAACTLIPPAPYQLAWRHADV